MENKVKYNPDIPGNEMFDQVVDSLGDVASGMARLNVNIERLEMGLRVLGEIDLEATSEAHENARCIRALEDQIARLMALLKECAWEHVSIRDKYYCMDCQQLAGQEHLPTCKIARLFGVRFGMRFEDNPDPKYTG